MITRNDIHELIKNRFGELEEKQTGNKTLLIGNPDKAKPYKWLISLYGPLGNDSQLFEKTKLNIPSVYKDFLVNVANGISFFSGALSIEGIRANYSRDPKVAIQEPLDLSLPNIEDRPKNSKDSYFYFGFYDWDGSRVYIDTADNKVCLCRRNDATALKSWDSFNEYIVEEVKRIITLFDEHGNQIDEDLPTTP